MPIFSFLEIENNPSPFFKTYSLFERGKLCTISGPVFSTNVEVTVFGVADGAVSVPITSAWTGLTVVKSGKDLGWAQITPERRLRCITWALAGTGTITSGDETSDSSGATFASSFGAFDSGVLEGLSGPVATASSLGDTSFANGCVSAGCKVFS